MRTFIEIITLAKTAFNALWQLAMGAFCLALAFVFFGFAYAIVKAAFYG